MERKEKAIISALGDGPAVTSGQSGQMSGRKAKSGVGERENKLDPTAPVHPSLTASKQYDSQRVTASVSFMPPVPKANFSSGQSPPRTT